MILRGPVNRFARIAPISEARTISKYPAFRATRAMINSGALPKVALSRPPIASPVRIATCSVACTISRAIGMMASAAEKEEYWWGNDSHMFQNESDRDKDE